MMWTTVYRERECSAASEHPFQRSASKRGHLEVISLSCSFVED